MAEICVTHRRVTIQGRPLGPGIQVSRSRQRSPSATLPGADSVAVVDMERMEVVERLPAGRQPWGLVVMLPPESAP